MIYDPIVEKSYSVQITGVPLNIRAGASTNYAVVGKIYDYSIYTIIETKNNFGKLKSGAGWISLDFTKKL